MTPEWFPDWSGKAVVIVASGESAKEVDLNLARGRCPVVVVNNGFRLAPWADALYAADLKWWEVYRDAVEFPGIKIAASADAAKKFGLRQIEFCDAAGSEEASVLSLAEKGKVARGGNSGFQAVNIAAQAGASKVILVGFDFCGSHWHGDHEGNLRNPRQFAMDRWAKTLDAQADILEAAGIDVINCSPDSRLTAYRKASFEMAMAEISDAEDATNFAAAEMYLAQAKAAADAGDKNREAAAKRMVMVALGLTEARPRIHTGHLSK